MDKLSPEIVHMIASLLDVDDLLSFRLVSKSLSDIGAAYLLPEVTFEAHEQELERLRAISQHPVLARYVRSLLYLGDRLETPPISFREYVRGYKRERAIGYATLGYDKARANMSLAQLEAEYRKYAAVAENQRGVLASRADVAALGEVLPRLTGLRELTMSDANQFYSRGLRRRQRQTPTNGLMNTCLSSRLKGGRQLEALLQANESARCGIESLRAGLLHWQFLDRDPAELRRLFGALSELKRFELVVTIEALGGTFDIYQAVRLFEDMMAKGAVRDVLSSMADLETLAVDFTCYVEEQFLGSRAALGHLIQPGYRWQNLQHLVLSGVNCPRQELTSVLQLHRDTLRALCLQDTDLKMTSWKEFLPWIRKNLDLDDVCICGYLVGNIEADGGHDEHWYFSSPTVGNHEMRSSVNMYCRRGGRCYPDKLPLSDKVVQKYYDKWVAVEFPREEEDPPMNEYMDVIEARLQEFQSWADLEDLGGDDDDNDDDYVDDELDFGYFFEREEDDDEDDEAAEEEDDDDNDDDNGEEDDSSSLD